jgi:hypothetical protein
VEWLAQIVGHARYCSASDGRFVGLYYWFRRPASATI